MAQTMTNLESNLRSNESFNEALTALQVAERVHTEACKMSHAECCKAANSFAAGCGIDMDHIKTYLCSEKLTQDILNFLWAGERMSNNLYWALATRGFYLGQYHIMMNVSINAKRDSSYRTLLIYLRDIEDATPIAVSQGFDGSDVDRYFLEKQLREYIAMMANSAVFTK